MVPSFSFFLSFSVSQMAILLTAAKKMLHSTVHMSPGMFVELFELQPPPTPTLKICSFSVDSEVALCYPQRVECIFRVQST